MGDSKADSNNKAEPKTGKSQDRVSHGEQARAIHTGVPRHLGQYLPFLAFHPLANYHKDL